MLFGNNMRLVGASDGTVGQYPYHERRILPRRHVVVRLSQQTALPIVRLAI